MVQYSTVWYGTVWWDERNGKINETKTVAVPWLYCDPQ